MTQPPRFFLSYTRQDVEELRLIGRTLMIHGIRTWQDIRSLGAGLTEAEIRNAIHNQCSGLVFYSTPSSIQSSIIKQVELRAAEDKHLHIDPLFNIVPIFKSSVKETVEALKGDLKIKISDFNGAIVKDNDVLSAAQQAARIILKQIILSKELPTPIGLASKQKTSGDVALDLDFTRYFADGLPAEGTWNQEFVPAMLAVKECLLDNRLQRLRLIAYAHLSLGFMFGYVFRERSGFALEIEQVTKSSREVWATDHKVVEECSLKIERKSVGDFDSKNLCVTINLVAKDASSFSNYVKKSGLSYRVLIEAAPPSYPYLISNGQALAITRELVNVIKEAHGIHGTNTVHIFAAIPLGLALLLGHQLNACGTIHCYEFDSKREYWPSCTLENF